MKIGLISDTHGHLDEKVFDHFKECDEIWHAGDIGTLALLKELQEFKTVRAVFGNIDGKDLRALLPEHCRFKAGGLSVWMTHIGGAPPRYNRSVRNEFKEDPPDLFVCGHSHILKIQSDQQLGGMIYLNPGAAGNQGFHKIKTIVRFQITAHKIEGLQVIELGQRGRL